MEPTLVVVVLCTAAATFVVVYAIFYFNRPAKMLAVTSNEFLDKPQTKKGNATRPHKAKKSKTEEVSKIPKLKARDIDIGKYNSRLAEFEDLESAYTAFLASHLADLLSRIATLTADVAAAEAGKTAVEGRIEEHKNARMAAENKCSEMKAVVSDLNGKLRKLTAEQNESANKILEARNEAASVISSQNRASEDYRLLKTKCDRVQNELLESKRDNKSMVFSLVKSEEERRGLLDQVRLVEKELESRQHELLSQITTLKTTIADLERSKIELAQDLEAKVQNMREAEQSKILERETLTSAHDQEKLGLQKEVDRAIGDLDGANILLTSLKERLQVLEEGHLEMERLKDKNTELRDRNQKLVERVNEMQTAMKSASAPEAAKVANEGLPDS